LLAYFNRRLIGQVLGTEGLFKYLDKYDIELSPAFDRLLDRYSAQRMGIEDDGGVCGRIVFALSQAVSPGVYAPCAGTAGHGRSCSAGSKALLE